MSEKKSQLLDLLQLLVSWRKQIITNFFIVCILVIIISTLIPKWYRSSITLLPPTDDTGTMGMSAIFNQLPINTSLLGLGGVSDQASMVLAILNSRRVLENVIGKFQLVELYKKKNVEETIKALRKRYKVELNDEGTITLSVLDKTPFFPFGEKNDISRHRSQDMANYFIQELDKINREIKTEKATNVRKFIEKRYFQNQEELADAEEALKKFQEKNGVIALPEQTEATITAASEIKKQIIEQQVMVGVLSEFYEDTHVELVKARKQLQELQLQLEKITSKMPNSVDNGNKDDEAQLLINLKKAPDLGIQYARLYREVEMQTAIMQFLLPQYEQAKIQEAKDSPTIQILDPANYPIRKAKPKRAIIVVAAGFFCLVLYVIAAYIILSLSEMQKSQPDQYQKMTQIFNDLKPARWFK